MIPDSKFTPGPWVVEEQGIIEIVAHESPRGPDGGPSIVAEVCDDGEEHGTTLADARLIAAAPDLYLALRHLAEACEVLQVPGIATHEARAALAKAVQR